MKPGDQGPRYVYFLRPIGMAGPVKVGSSRLPAERLALLMAWSPFPLEIVVSIPGSMKVEMAVHAAFADDHLHHEWFSPSERLTQLMNDLIAGRPVAELIDLAARARVTRAGRWSDEQRRAVSYTHRLRWAKKRLPKHAWFHSPEINEIIYRWRPNAGQVPTAAELALLEDAIANPAKYAVEPADRVSA